MTGTGLSWATIKEWKSSGLVPVVEDLIEERRTAMAVHDSIASIDVTSNWKGSGASSAQDALGKLKETCAHHLGLIGELLSATGVAQDGVGEVEKLVAEAETFAFSWGLVIDEMGQVRGSSDTMTPAELHVIYECSIKVKEACDRASETDAEYSRALNDVSEGKDANPESFDDSTPGLPDLPKEGASTEEIAAWWYSLSNRERADIADKAVKDIEAGRPSKYEALGNMDGIDASTRNQINRARLDRDIESLKKRKSEIVSKASASDIPSNKLFNPQELNDIDQRLKEAEGIKAALDYPEDKSVPPEVGLYFYEPGTGEDGHEATHAALVVGDIDNADNVTTYVPGMTTSVEGEGSTGLVNEMRGLKARAEAEGKGGVAAIAWVGYDAPPAPWTGDTSVASTHDAELGGNSLAKHLEGVEDSRNASGRPVHQSVLGHSYGSTTSSYGVAQVRPGVVDDYAVFGSPGVKDAAAMRVPEGHSYAMTYLPGPNGAGDINNSLNYYVSDVKGGTGALGIDPHVPGSGFKIMDPGGSGAKHSWDAHTRYLDEGTQAQSILAKVVAGTAG